MANYVFTSYAIDGKIEKLKKDLKKSVDDEIKEYSYPLSLYGVFNRISDRFNQIDKRSRYGIGNDECGVLYFQTETPYGRDKTIEKVLKELYPSINVYFEEEGTEDGIFRSNDAEGKYFGDSNYYLDDAENGSEHFDTLEEMLDHFNSTYGTSCIDGNELCLEIMKMRGNGIDINVIEKDYI